MTTLNWVAIGSAVLGAMVFLHAAAAATKAAVESMPVPEPDEPAEGNDSGSESPVEPIQVP